MTVSHFYTIRPRTEPPNDSYLFGAVMDQRNSKDYRWRALGRIFDDTCVVMSVVVCGGVVV